MRIGYLDGLRGLASFGVVVFHLNVDFVVLEDLLQLRLAQARVGNGNFAVCISSCSTAMLLWVTLGY